MSVYNLNGESITDVYNTGSDKLAQAYDLYGNPLLDGEEPFIKTTLPYDTSYIINSAWLDNAATQRDAIKALYQQSEDAIPFFIQTDGHGRDNEGNKGCHNLAEPVMRYIVNMQLGDFQSYYHNGNNPARHLVTSAGITNYICAMGNHEFLNNNSPDAELADLPTLIDSFTPPNGILGSQTYGYYKVLDSKYHVKYLVTQPHIPDAHDSGGFIGKITGDQYEWLIDELESNDGYDVVVLQHEELNGLYTQRDGTTYTRDYSSMSIKEILADRKAKVSGSYTDSDGVTHNYDFTNCQSDLLCSFHGHRHAEAYITKDTLGFPVYVGTEFYYTCAYGLIDRANGKLHIYSFNRQTVNEPLVLDL